MSINERDHAAQAGPADSGHDEWEELAVGYALTALEPDELGRFVEHLVHFCPQCSQAVSDTEIVGAGLASSIPVEAPPASLRESVLSAALSARPAVPQTTADVPEELTGPVEISAPAPVFDELAERRARRALKTSRGGWLAAAAAGVVAIALAGTTWSAVQNSDHQKSLADSRANVVSAVTSNSGVVVPVRRTDGTTVATVVAHTGSVSVVSSNMTANSASTSYVLWGIATNSAPVALGVFDANGKALQTVQVASDSRGKYSSFPTFAISQEPGHVAPAKPSKVVASGNV